MLKGDFDTVAILTVGSMKGQVRPAVSTIELNVVGQIHHQRRLRQRLSESCQSPWQNERESPTTQKVHSLAATKARVDPSVLNT
jgi:hypothetical protein